MLKLQNAAPLCAFKMTVGFGLRADLLPLNSSEINSGSSQLPWLAHLSVTEQGVSGPAAL